MTLVSRTLHHSKPSSDRTALTAASAAAAAGTAQSQSPHGCPPRLFCITLPKLVASHYPELPNTQAAAVLKTGQVSGFNDLRVFRHGKLMPI